MNDNDEKSLELLDPWLRRIQMFPAPNASKYFLSCLPAQQCQLRAGPSQRQNGSEMWRVQILWGWSPFVARTHHLLLYTFITWIYLMIKWQFPECRHCGPSRCQVDWNIRASHRWYALWAPSVHSASHTECSQSWSRARISETQLPQFWDFVTFTLWCVHWGVLEAGGLLPECPAGMHDIHACCDKDNWHGGLATEVLQHFFVPSDLHAHTRVHAFITISLW